MRLMYQFQSSQWLDNKLEIEGISTSSDLLTHAALCPEKGGFSSPMSLTARADCLR